MKISYIQKYLMKVNSQQWNEMLSIQLYRHSALTTSSQPFKNVLTINCFNFSSVNIQAIDLSTTKNLSKFYSSTKTEIEKLTISIFIQVATGLFFIYSLRNKSPSLSFAIFLQNSNCPTFYLYREHTIFYLYFLAFMRQPKDSVVQFIFNEVSAEAILQKSFGLFKSKTKKLNILKSCSGQFSPGSMTAIIGPSGSGKTTLLNILSGRLFSDNLHIFGSLSLNGKQIVQISKYRQFIGFVAQQDYLLSAFTPRQTFTFVVNMKFRQKSEPKKGQMVEKMLVSLGLLYCADSYIGNNMMKGLSGGQKKRVSIGLELINNPPLLLLDQPTTGLDSTTSLNLIKLLNKFSTSGKTVITTIHQPSSEIFALLDMIMFMVQGTIVYHGKAEKSIAYFQTIGFPVPQYSNPFNHYIKLMNKEAIIMKYIEKGQAYSEEEVDREFHQQIHFLLSKYLERFTQPRHQVFQKISRNTAQKASTSKQIYYIFQRSIKTYIRQPVGFLADIVVMVFLAIFEIILFQRESSSLDGYILYMRGLSSSVSLIISCLSMLGSVNLFNEQWPVTYREKLSGIYAVYPFFVGKTLAQLINQLLHPLVFICILYFAIHLERNETAFIIFLSSSWLAIWMASGYGVLISIVFSDLQTAMIFAIIVILPLNVVTGMFAPQQNFHGFFKAFSYISPFKYHYQTLIYSQFYSRTNGWSITLNGKLYQYKGNILAKGNQLHFQEPFWLSMLLMFLLGVMLKIICLLVLYIKSNKKSLKLRSQKVNTIESEITLEQQTAKMFRIEEKKQIKAPYTIL